MLRSPLLQQKPGNMFIVKNLLPILKNRFMKCMMLLKTVRLFISWDIRLPRVLFFSRQKILLKKIFLEKFPLLKQQQTVTQPMEPG